MCVFSAYFLVIFFFGTHQIEWLLQRFISNEIGYKLCWSLPTIDKFMKQQRVRTHRSRNKLLNVTLIRDGQYKWLTIRVCIDELATKHFRINQKQSLFCAERIVWAWIIAVLLSIAICKFQWNSSDVICRVDVCLRIQIIIITLNTFSIAGTFFHFVNWLNHITGLVHRATCLMKTRYRRHKHIWLSCSFLSNRFISNEPAFYWATPHCQLHLNLCKLSTTVGRGIFETFEIGSTQLQNSLEHRVKNSFIKSFHWNQRFKLNFQVIYNCIFLESFWCSICILIHLKFCSMEFASISIGSINKRMYVDDFLPVFCFHSDKCCFTFLWRFFRFWHMVNWAATAVTMRECENARMCAMSMSEWKFQRKYAH